MGKLMALLLYQVLKLTNRCAPTFPDFFVIGTQNWDLPEVIYGQKVPKSSIVMWVECEWTNMSFAKRNQEPYMILSLFQVMGGGARD